MRFMPFKATLCALSEIRDNGRQAQTWMAGRTLENVRNNVQLVYAVTRCPEIVSKPSRGLPQALRDRHPELPCRAIMDVGNVYRHEYDNVSKDLVWRTVHEKLPELLAIIEGEIASLSDNPE